ncbi:MAG: helix-turn-helix domain-containing protein [Patescibacteria group bacterium]
MITHKDLERFGLSEKEARVYLASLELGPATAAQIAQKAGVNRATTYVEIESLMKMGLVSTHEKNKKTLFTAEDPEALKRILQRRQERFQRAHQALNELLPELSNLYHYAGEKPKVRFFEGKEGLLTMQEDFLKTKDKMIEGLYNVDNYHKVFSRTEREQYYAVRLKKKIHGRTLYNREAGPFDSPDKITEDRFVSTDKFNFSSDITIYDSKVAIASLRGKLMGVIIENEEIANTVRALFRLAWDAAEKYQK